MKVEPRPTRLRTATDPMWNSASSFTSARPTPVPTPRAACPVNWWNRSKILARSSGGTPAPSSSTSRKNCAPRRPQRTVMWLGRISVPPVKRSAFPRRFSAICSIFSRSSGTRGRASSASSRSSTWRLRAASRPLSTTPRKSSAASTSSSFRNSRLASSRARWSRAFTWRRRRSALRCMASSSARSSLGTARPAASIASSGATMSVSGVRSSCETFVKKLVFTRSSSICVSMSFFCASSSRRSATNERTSSAMRARAATTMMADAAVQERRLAGGMAVFRQATSHCTPTDATRATTVESDDMRRKTSGGTVTANAQT
ncbi:MAG TPA: hypothetical protein VFK90_17900 [Anaeromyxobacter sp.]|nr:hypothetical protein [Anaeromyxobacter sp.]